MDEITWRRIDVIEDGKPFPCRYHTCIIYNDYMWIFGGARGSKSMTNSFYCIDINTLTQWIEVPTSSSSPPPSPRSEHTAVVYGDSMYVYGGWDATTVFNDLYVFNFNDKTWRHIRTEDALSPPARRNHIAVVHGTKMFIWGGAKDKMPKGYLNDMWMFDFVTEAWSLVTITSEELPVARAGHIAFVLSDILYIYGGFNGDGGFDYLSDMYSMDLTEVMERTWKPMESSGHLPFTSRAVPVVTYLEAAWVFGGYDGNLKIPQNTLHHFNPNTASWTTTDVWLDIGTNITAVTATNAGMKATPRYGHTAVVTTDGDMIIFGGSGSTYLNDTIVFSLPDTT